MNDSGGVKDLLIASTGYIVAFGSLWAYGKIKTVNELIFRYGVYAGIFTMLIYCLSLRFRAQGIDPRSKLAFKEYLKLGSVYCIVLFISSLPIMLTSL